LTFAEYSIDMDEHDRAAAFAAFDTALAVSPSTALTYILGRSSLSGNIVVAYPATSTAD